MDNPTELARSDIDATILALLGNDAMMISDNIEGTLKFGKVCAEVKSLVIDLEAYGESYGDRAQAEQYALAA